MEIRPCGDVEPKVTNEVALGVVDGRRVVETRALAGRVRGIREQAGVSGFGVDIRRGVLSVEIDVHLRRPAAVPRRAIASPPRERPLAADLGAPA